MENEKKQGFGKLVTVLAIAALALLIYNQFQLISLKSIKSTGSGLDLPTGMAIASASVMPAGTAKVYGKELGINYDGVSPNNPELTDKTIAIMANLDRTITLSGQELQRYINIASQISCEYCCGAKSIIFSNGQAACGCAHSYAMRGLAKYLIKNHPNEFTDDEILEELAKWKTLFFPAQMQAKASVLAQKGIEFSYVNLGSNKYRGIEKGALAGGGMVGGC